VGEVVGTGAPIMNIATDDAWFTFNVREDLLPGINIGNKIKVYLPASNETIPARVTLIKNVGNFVSWKATRALEDVDLKVFEVQARPMASMKTPHEGMSVIIVN
jgi:HlyD family secretion protein